MMWDSPDRAVPAEHAHIGDTGSSPVSHYRKVARDASEGVRLVVIVELPVAVRVQNPILARPEDADFRKPGSVPVANHRNVRNAA